MTRGTRHNDDERAVPKIDADARTVRTLLSSVKYTIDYYQREYKWQAKNIAELLEDLENRFVGSYRERDERTAVEKYSHYFLGSIVLNQEQGYRYIIDGQQRLTSLTLLLIYLHNLQKQQKRPDEVDVQDLIFSEKFGKKTYNLDVEERNPCIEALFRGQVFDPTDASESVQNIYDRYQDIVSEFPETLKGAALPYFIDWLLENVEMVEIRAYTDDDAYTIFETMNDRGVSLSPTDMLKGYLLANIDGGAEKAHANAVWKKHMRDLAAIGKEEEADFFKAWLRAKYADTLRDRKKGAANEDFERIGTTFHKWVRDRKARIGLERSADFARFVEYRFAHFSRYYRLVREAALTFDPRLAYVYYNDYHTFTLQYPLVLAPIRDEDDQDTALRKIRLVAGYLDILIARRIWNFRTLSNSALNYTMYNLVREIRDKSVPELVDLLTAKVAEMPDPFAANDRFQLHQQNRRQVHYLLARITRHIEEQAGVPGSFAHYINRDAGKPFEIEHIWGDRYERHRQEFDHQRDFEEYRQRIGDLVLLPRGFNQSLGDRPYEEKADTYTTQNLLVRSLTEQCYRNNPSFLSYVQRSGLPFQAYAHFGKAELDERQDLYRRICEEIWSPKRFALELQ